MDIIIPVSKNYMEQLQMTLPFVKKNLSFDRIIIITNKMNFPGVAEDSVVYVDENKLLDFTYSDVEKLIVTRGGDKSRTGWYFQQFLKIGYAKVCMDTHYLVWDADTIPLKNIEFLNGDKMLFNMKNEHHEPYFETIKTLFNQKITPFTRKKYSSFISEGMIINTEIMRNMISDIEGNSDILGESFWEKIINAISIVELSRSGFSEFETYGSYLLTYYPALFQERPLKTERFGYTMFGGILSDEEFRKTGLDTVSYEGWDKKSKLKLLRRLYIKIRRRLYDL